jgi:6-phosphogluconolactonase/glucosamine-6-phosphate isomerase/deaminase
MTRQSRRKRGESWRVVDQGSDPQAGKGGDRLSTGLSQLDMLSRLVEQDIPWEKVEAFHVDEYVGLSETDKASFRSYLKTYFVSKVPNVGGDALY